MSVLVLVPVHSHWKTKLMRSSIVLESEEEPLSRSEGRAMG